MIGTPHPLNQKTKIQGVVVYLNYNINNSFFGFHYKLVPNCVRYSIYTPLFVIIPNKLVYYHKNTPVIFQLSHPDLMSLGLVRFLSRQKS